MEMHRKAKDLSDKILDSDSRKNPKFVCRRTEQNTVKGEYLCLKN